MTAQAPDSLEFDGNAYRVYEFIDLPAGVALPPKEILVQSTSHWRGYTARWEIREQDGRFLLFMLGFQCDDYLPLCRPYFNPITGTVRLVPDKAELLRHEHMGFQSKYAGELRFRFIAGELVGIVPIADTTMPQDGLLDLAELGPGGKEGWLEQVSQRPRGREPFPIPPDVQKMLEQKDHPEPKQAPCAACRTLVSLSGCRYGDSPACADCANRLFAIARMVPNWHASAPSDSSSSISLTSRTGSDGHPIDAKWYAGRGQFRFVYLSHEPDGAAVRCRIKDKASLLVRRTIDAPGNSKDSVLRRLTEELSASLRADEKIECRVSYERGIHVVMRRALVLRVDTRARQMPISNQDIAAQLATKLETEVERWRKDLSEMERLIRTELPGLVEKFTAQAHRRRAASASDLTPTDREILVWTTRGPPRYGEREWAVLPRHTSEGWLPGETVQERYQKSLNL